MTTDNAETRPEIIGPPDAFGRRGHCPSETMAAIAAYAGREGAFDVPPGGMTFNAANMLALGATAARPQLQETVTISEEAAV